MGHSPKRMKEKESRIVAKRRQSSILATIHRYVGQPRPLQRRRRFGQVHTRDTPPARPTHAQLPTPNTPREPARAGGCGTGAVGRRGVGRHR